MSLEVDTPVISWHALSPEPPPSFTLQSLIDRNMSPGASRSRFRTTFDWSASLMRQKLAAFLPLVGQPTRCWKLFLDHAGFVVFVAYCSRYCCVYVKILPLYHPKQAVSVALAIDLCGQLCSSSKLTFATLHIHPYWSYCMCLKPPHATCCKLYLNTVGCAKTWSWVSFGLNLLLLLPPLSHAASMQPVHQNFDLMLLEYFTWNYCAKTN